MSCRRLEEPRHVHARLATRPGNGRLRGCGWCSVSSVVEWCVVGCCSDWTRYCSDGVLPGAAGRALAAAGGRRCVAAADVVVP